ncbi:DUF3553 domain-containing protein [Brytella acorum]|uniref:DUF3553 domain-containing protein n=1 Tax=Brytella acorum TaxID=2959299 RepID=A0AA35UUJ2_9PROT|nr:DUF3553 domain-containing protein [Brytella acorum]MDF3624454.1 DUF3553 domain-containing protein [Brytella acorum]CAI9119696.1 DUF3553 domain-containing protein [Brytella acorum]
MSTTQRDYPFNAFLEPGQIVMHPEHDEWGKGQVQSVIGARVTVNFADVGKVLIDASRVTLTVIG